ncbi:hypothetical protein L1049_025883 [Liquidambar formosana]|uniref:DUF7812 domain-containing protein n=1 Tax=Liquidambar formosana TaxID=63359 RepID=A0AAP0NEG8_LIQFO
MVSTRKNRYDPANENPPPHIFQTLMAAFQAPEGLKPPVLKSLYCLIIRLSLNKQICCSDLRTTSNCSNQFGFKVTFQDICDLSNIMFKQLCERFKQIFSALNGLSASQAHGPSGLCSDTWTISEELLLLLRCCLVVLTLFDPPDQQILEKSKLLISILSRLRSLDFIGGREKNGITFKASVSRESACTNNGCTTSVAEDFVASLRFLEPSDPCLPFLRAMLEVFVDELLVHESLRVYFMLSDSVSSVNEMLFIYPTSHGDAESVAEVFSAHFLISVSDEQAFENFLSGLVWQHGKDYRVPELSLAAAVSLLCNPIMLSAPKIFQAHLISLVSEAIGIGTASENMRVDIRLMDCYLSAFERSVILYTRHMSSVQRDGHPVSANDSVIKSYVSGRSSQLSFESYVQPLTRNKINHVVTIFETSWHTYIHDMFLGTKSDLVSSSIDYIKDNQEVLDKSCKDEILSILSCIILRASGDVNDTSLNKIGDSSLQDIYLLSSILKLMSSSLLQALWCVRHDGNLGCLKSLKDFSSCTDYDFIVGIIGCFRQFDACLPIQKFLCDVMESHPMRHKESKLMLLHFSGLLSFSFASGLDFLVKGCIYTMMILMNLFIFEEGNLGALSSLLSSESKSFSFQLSTDKVGEVSILFALWL